VKITRHLVGIAAAGLVLGSGSLSAQSVRFNGTTQGCFATGRFAFPDCNTMGYGAVDQYLYFLGGSFDQTSSNTDPGYTGIGTDPSKPTSNFGYFGLAGLPATYTDDVFRLSISFQNPLNVSPDAVFEAVLFGNVTWKGEGGVDITFDSPATFSFAGPQYSGTFDLYLDDVSVSPATLLAPVAVTGFIESHVSSNVTATPEPGTIALMATGFMGLVPAVRLRRKKTLVA
jgi:hypothetical protein